MINDFAPDSFHDVILTIIRCFTMDLAKRVLWWGSVWDQLSRFKQNQSVTCYCVRVHSVMCDLLTWGNNLYHGIISLRGDVRVHDTITSPLFLLHTFFIEVPLPSLESERSCIWVLLVTLRFYLFLRFWYFILKLFWQCGIFLNIFQITIYLM